MRPNSNRDRRSLLASMALVCLAGHGLAQSGPSFEMTRMVAHWAQYGQPEYVDFIGRAQPDVAQVGFYGAHFWSLVHTAEYGGYPAHFPVRGIKEASEWFRELNGKLHERGVKVVGHFNVEFLVGDPDSPEGPRGFFRFYRDLWDESVLGPKPEKDPIALLEKKSDGKPISDGNYGIGGMKEYWACLRNPSWQAVLKAWVKRGIELGLDGFVANYFYRHDCTCEHCVRAFREYLQARFNQSELKVRFGIEDLAQHRFPEIVSWHDPAQSTPLRREMLRFSQISNKQVFDEVFLSYGRSLKPDLLAAQWNHLGDFSQVSGDERCFLPADLWGKGEDYLWYSLGGSANYTDLAKGFLGEGTLQARYIRGAFADKPFTLGKYESTRIRASIAELAANGGAPMGFYTDFTNAAAREVIVEGYQFLKRHDALFRASRSASEAVLLFPRKAVHGGDLGPLGKFRDVGRALLDRHVLFDVLPDDLADPERLGKYARVLDPAKDAVEPWLDRFKERSRFEAPGTVRVSASRPAKDDSEWDVHFVNYNRTEPPPQADGRPSPGAGAQDEKPLAVKKIGASLRLSASRRVVSVHVISPENPDGAAVPFEMTESGVRFTLDEVLVYAVARVRTE